MPLGRRERADRRSGADARCPGIHVANALGAFAAGVELGIDPGPAAADALARAERVPGRFEPVDAGQGFVVLVDCTRTPTAGIRFEDGAAADQSAADPVLGAGGDRDRDKRPKMGRPGPDCRTSRSSLRTTRARRDPGSIVAEVDRRDRERRRSYEVEPDRRAAIALALGSARPGDTVVIAGKGHEQGQEFAGGRKVPFDDREVAREELRKLGGPA